MHFIFSSDNCYFTFDIVASLYNSSLIRYEKNIDILIRRLSLIKRFVIKYPKFKNVVHSGFMLGDHITCGSVFGLDSEAFGNSAFK